MEIADDKLKQKAKMVVYAIYLTTQEFEKSVYGKIKEAKPIKELVIASEEDKNFVEYITMVCFLFQAQKFFLERVIKDNKIALRFEKYLYEVFQEITSLNPKEYISDIGEYIKKQGSEGELMYLGSRICRQLNKIDGILMAEINIQFAALLKYGFFESLKNAWEYKSENEK